MPGRRTFALLLLVLAAFAAAGPLLLPADCDDEGCPPACGDCLACGLVADRAPLPMLAARLVSVAVAPLSRTALPSFSPRQLDHVPLSTTA
jgi:hypothetical protein